MRYEGHWRVYKIWRMAHCLLLVSAPLWFFLFTPVAESMGRKVHGDEASRPGMLLVSVAPWIIAVAFSFSWWSFWPCPRCRKPFFAKWWGYMFLGRKCAHCGLRKFECEDEHVTGAPDPRGQESHRQPDLSSAERNGPYRSNEASAPWADAQTNSRDVGSSTLRNSLSGGGQPGASELEKWRELHRLRRRFLLLLLTAPALISYGFVLSLVLPRIPTIPSVPRLREVLGAFLVAPLFIILPMCAAKYVGVHLRLIKLPCPRCGWPFFTKWWSSRIWTRRCLHCGASPPAGM